MAEETTSLEAVAGLMLTEQERSGADPVPIELVTRDFFGGLRPRLYTGRGSSPRITIRTPSRLP